MAKGSPDDSLLYCEDFDDTICVLPFGFRLFISKPPGDEAEVLSKREKKLLKRDRSRCRMRELRPTKRRNKKLKEQAARRALLDSLSNEDRESYVAAEKQEYSDLRGKMEETVSHAFDSGFRICINCSFNDSMQTKHLKSLAKQMFFSYHYMKNQLFPIQFHYSSFSEGDSLHEECKVYMLDQWKVHLHESPYWELFNPEETIVLTPDAEEELTEVDPSKVYVIGGLVDPLVNQCESLLQALRHKMTCRKFPLKPYLKEYINPIFNINSVVEILIQYLRTHDWAVALQAGVPQRKQASCGRRGRKRQLKRLNKSHECSDRITEDSHNLKNNISSEAREVQEPLEVDTSSSEHHLSASSALNVDQKELFHTLYSVYEDSNMLRLVSTIFTEQPVC